VVMRRKSLYIPLREMLFKFTMIYIFQKFVLFLNFMNTKFRLLSMIIGQVFDLCSSGVFVIFKEL